MLQKASRAHFWKEAEGRGSWSFVSFWGQKLQILDGNQAWEWTHWAGGFVGSDLSRNLWSIGCWRQLLAADGWYGARSRRWGTVHSCLSSNMKAHCAKLWSMELKSKKQKETDFGSCTCGSWMTAIWLGRGLSTRPSSKGLSYIWNAHPGFHSSYF
jgi:hypothetical protein